MDVVIEHNEAAHRYELLVGGELASYADYRPAGDQVVFPHTVTIPRFRGRGLAARVVRKALDDTRAAGRTVVPTCWFVAQFIDDHPEYQDLLASAEG